MPHWQDKIVLITGGSAGLGAHLARAWSRAGAQVIIVARDVNRLQTVVEGCSKDGISLQSRAVDITDPTQVASLAEWVQAEWGQLDVIVNAAGKSDRGRVSETSLETFEELWKLNFLAAVNCTQTFLPLLKKSSGCIVNIGSLAAKTAAPFIGAYPSSKFPIAAFSQQLRVELALDHSAGAPPPPHVLLVCPGPIARDDGGDRYGSKSKDLPESARQPGGGARVRAIDPARLSAQILRACESRQLELVVPRKSRILFLIQSLSPAWGDYLLRRMISRK